MYVGLFVVYETIVELGQPSRHALGFGLFEVGACLAIPGVIQVEICTVYVLGTVL